MKKEELKEILDKHLKWLGGEEGGERANLSGSNLSGSDLRGSNLSYSNLRGSNLSGSDLSYSNLRGSNLSGSDLSYSNLRGSDLSYSNLSGSNLRCSNLSGSNLSGIKEADKIQDILISHTSICPEGTIIGWKKCRNNVVVKLEIPAEAKRSNATGRKCRAEYAKVLEVIGAEVGISQHNLAVVYKAGEIIYPDKWDEDRWNECSHGIHFFITKLEAEKY